MTYDLG